MSNYRFIGKDIKKVDAFEKVTGRLKYAGDLEINNLHYGKILFSKFPRAKCIKIDTEKARKVPGVKAVLTYKDVKGKNIYGYGVEDQPLLVPEGGITNYIGDAIAFVVADNDKIAEQACKLIEVTYEELPSVSSIRDAQAPNAPIIHDSVEKNICCRRDLVWGDTGKGFQQCKYIVEQIYKTQRAEHAFLEPEAGVAYVDDKGVLHIYASLQYPYVIAKDIADALGIPQSRIHIKGMPVGGGFGGKLDTTMQVHLAAMALLTGVPVKLVFSREESFRFHPKRHPYEIRIKIGADQEGKLLAMEAEVKSDAGPYSGRTPEVLGLTVNSLPWPYNIPNVKVRGVSFYTNNLLSGAFRGFGAPQAAFAREAILDKLAKVIGISPLELRRKNFIREDEKTKELLLGEISLEALTEALLEKAGDYPIPSAKGKVVGRGFCFDMPVFDVSAMPMIGKAGVGIAVEVFSDGTVGVYSGATELGQGITTVLAQIACEELGVEEKDVLVELSDNKNAPRAGRTSASRLTYVCGNALLLAIRPIRERLLEKASVILGVKKADLVLEKKYIYSKTNLDKKISLDQVASMCINEGIKLREEAWYRYPGEEVGYGHTFMASAADVEVDLETGDVKIIKLINIHDTGKVINPSSVRGQLIGGAVQAIGYAFMEDMITEKGFLKTTSLSEYLVPTSLDVPDHIITGSLEVPYPTGPYGAKGIGEHALNSTTPALINAISQATGLEFTCLPVLPEHILLALEGQVKKGEERNESRA